MPCRRSTLAIATAVLACGAPWAFAQDAMTPTTTVDPAAQTTPETPVDPARPTDPQTPVDPARPAPPAAPPPATPTAPTTPTNPGAPPAPARAPEPATTGTAVLMQGGQEVRVSSRAPDSVVGQYRVDFAALDGNGDGHITRAEARGNASLTAEFHVADRNADGRLTPEELSGWTK